MDLDPGTVVANRYRISRPLGRGGMGEVFAAENIRTGRPVAVKLLRSDTKGKSSAVARFRQEARAAGSINSDHVTQVLDVEEDPEFGVVLVFELLEGESLIDRLKRAGPISLGELHPIIEQVWLGLAAAHRVGIIHRDLKPSNVFLEQRPDGTTRVKILDFGISKLPKEMGGETLTEMGQSLGTFSFMPPEQIGKAKTVDHRADIYACATLIYQSLTGQLPYAARNILVMVEMKTKTDARKLSEGMGAPVDARLEAFVSRALSRDPAARYQTAMEALAAWRELRPGVSQRPSMGHGPISPPVNSAVPRTPPPAAILDASDLRTDGGGATLAMNHAGRPREMPTLEPRLDAPPTRRPVGLGGTMVYNRAADPRMRPDDPTRDEKPPLAPPPPVAMQQAPYYAQQAVAMNRPPAPQPAPQQQYVPQGGPPVAMTAPLPRIYDDPTSGPGSSEGATTVYRPKAGDPRQSLLTAPQVAAPAQPQPPPRKRGVPLLVVLLGFLVVGFLAVAALMQYLKVR